MEIGSLPKVTIGIPTYNRGTMVPTAILSALSQGHQNIEIIVSDNNSSDGTLEALKQFESVGSVRILKSEENSGMVANWNKCLNYATGKFFLLLSDDDTLHPQAITALLDGISRHSTPVVYGDVNVIRDDHDSKSKSGLTGPVVESVSEFVSNVFCHKRAAFPSATLWRTEVLKQQGGYPSTVGTATDLGAIISLTPKGLIACVDVPVADYRLHSGSLSLGELVIESYAELYLQLSVYNFPRPIIVQFRRYALAVLQRLAMKALYEGEELRYKKIEDEMGKLGMGYGNKLLLLLVGVLSKSEGVKALVSRLLRFRSFMKNKGRGSVRT